MSATLIFVLIAVVAPMAINECSEVAPWLAQKILRWSARRLRAPEKVERYTEEWLADLERVPGKLTKLLFALEIATIGVTKLRSPRGYLDWEPGPMVNPFATDSIFGKGTPGLAALESRGTFATLPLRPTDPNAAKPGHQCGGLCGLNCAWTNDTRLTAVPTIDGHDGVADSVELTSPIIYRPQGPRGLYQYGQPPSWQYDTEHRSKYRVDGELFYDAVPQAAPMVIGDGGGAPPRSHGDPRNPRSPRSEFAKAMRIMRTAETPSEREHGFQMLAPQANTYIRELLDAFVNELENDKLLYRLHELIAKARTNEAFRVLATQLHSSDEVLRYWAVRGLEGLGTPQATMLLTRLREKEEELQRTA